MLTEEQIQWIVEKLNVKINLPVIGEKLEARILDFAVRKVMDLLEKELPKELLAALQDSAEGFEPGREADFTALKNNLTRFINKKINIPLLGEEKEEEIFSQLVEILIEAMKKNKKVGQE
ncbi:MAG: hypothetical protein WD077_01475 [Bacteroidia bacterium]